MGHTIGTIIELLTTKTNKMNKQEVSQRVLKNGNPLNEDLFSWDEKTNTFSSNEDGLVLCFDAVSHCTFKTGFDCTFKTGSYCTFNTGSDCTFKTGNNCTFDTVSNCTFKTISYCTFKTGSYCTFKTGNNCTFDTGANCTFNTKSNCVIVRRDVFEVIVSPTRPVKTCPHGIAGYLIEKDGKWYMDEVEHVVIDGILSKVISHKGNVYKVVNHGEEQESYIVTDGANYSHGKTLKEAKESLIYKISDRDTSAFKGLTVDNRVSFDEAIKMYRKITGACEGGVRGFVSALPSVKDSYTIKEVIELTEGKYNNNLFKSFFNQQRDL